MIIQKMFMFSGIADRAAIKDISGNYFSFRLSPAREITEKDLLPIPYYQEKGKRAIEAEPYMYEIYDLQRETK